MKSKILSSLLASFFMLLVFSCGDTTTTNKTSKTTGKERPHSPWVFRSVLDTQARILTLALDDKMWVSYHTEKASLDKAWSGGVIFQGAVYNTMHGPQPVSYGDAWIVNKYENPWLLVKDHDATLLTVRYKGHKIDGDYVQLMYELQTPKGDKINVTEQVEHFKSGTHQQGLERIFTVENVPSGFNLALLVNISSISKIEDVETDGTLEIIETFPRKLNNSVEGVDLDAKLVLKESGSTRLAVTFLGTPFIVNENNAKRMDEDLPKGAKLIAQNDCKTCHNRIKKTVGPAYRDIARKYDNTESNRAYLVAKVKNGSIGVWGETPMTPHPEVADEDITEMINYIMAMDAEEEALTTKETGGNDSNIALQESLIMEDKDVLPGVLMTFWKDSKGVKKMSEVNFDAEPMFETIVSDILIQNTDITWMEENYIIRYEGYIDIPENETYAFRLASDDGSMFYLNDKLLIDNDGPHGTEMIEGSTSLAKGKHALKVDFFQGVGGKSLSLQWKPSKKDKFEQIPISALLHHRSEQLPNPKYEAPVSLNASEIPGDGFSLQGVHPSYEVTQARPDDFTPKVAGMDFLEDGRLVISTWDAVGGVYILDNVASGKPSKITVKRIAEGLAEPLGLKVVDNEIYILQKQELTKLIDNDGDDIIDEYQAISQDWLVSANFHEFAFGLAYKDGYFYATLATAIEPGGASTNPQVPDRGKVAKISKETGKVEFIAQGLRTPNGIGEGVDGELFVADNEGDWLPSCKILHVKEGAWYGSRSVDYAGTDGVEATLPVVWLPQNEIGNSPSQPTYLNDGPYKGQMIHGEVTHGGLKRVFVEKVNGNYQGVVFRFTQGIEAGVNRIVWGPDGALYMGGIGSTGNWQHTGGLWYGLQRMKFKEDKTFEMLAVRAKSNGFEIEFTEALQKGQGWNTDDYQAKQWYYQPTENYGGPKMDEKPLPIQSVQVSEDRKKVFLELGGMKPEHVVYLRIATPFISQKGHELWSSEAWYTLNAIPENDKGFVSSAAKPKTAMNTLTKAEKTQGWKLMFDGKSFDGWHNYGKETVGSSWKVEEGAMVLNTIIGKDGNHKVEDGGDIVSDEEYENFELMLEWKIQPCGNSGIFYNVVESEEYDAVWRTGSEMQVLDNVCHPDAKYPKHRAGDLYDLISVKYETVKPAGSWNQARIVSKNGKVEHWLNGRKLVEFEMFTPEWEEMIAGSKFHDMPGFGKARKGHISLQDHSDKVWYRNVKIREL
ncbi:MAG: family 16 glycoside hydrolase [Chitinophagales bacterium]